MAIPDSHIDPALRPTAPSVGSHVEAPITPSTFTTTDTIASRRDANTSHADATRTSDQPLLPADPLRDARGRPTIMREEYTDHRRASVGINTRRASGGRTSGVATEPLLQADPPLNTFQQPTLSRDAYLAHLGQFKVKKQLLAACKAHAIRYGKTTTVATLKERLAEFWFPSSTSGHSSRRPAHHSSAQATVQEIITQIPASTPRLAPKHSTRPFAAGAHEILDSALGSTSDPILAAPPAGSHLVRAPAPTRGELGSGVPLLVSTAPCARPPHASTSTRQAPSRTHDSHTGVGSSRHVTSAHLQSGPGLQDTPIDRANSSIAAGSEKTGSPALPVCPSHEPFANSAHGIDSLPFDTGEPSEGSARPGEPIDIVPVVVDPDDREVITLGSADNRRYLSA
ncbi:hypothetical protein GGX14DRAFT_573385 [Mycena pura]|uniref:Uncharacterized protein n=1 Tax=Mycena pura TaxID=153505 RepID=A0AAD6Y7W7_9AGAR|nr:hypothetical protein GGX14DRAFT_573385 [Mycena pura]